MIKNKIPEAQQKKNRHTSLHQNLKVFDHQKLLPKSKNSQLDKVFLNHICWRISIFKKICSRKKPWTKNLYELFLKQGIQLASGHLKWCSVSLSWGVTASVNDVGQSSLSWLLMELNLGCQGPKQSIVIKGSQVSGFWIPGLTPRKKEIWTRNEQNTQVYWRKVRKNSCE